MAPRPPIPDPPAAARSTIAPGPHEVPGTARTRRCWSRLITSVALLTGVAASALAGWSWAGYQQGVDRQQFADQARSVAAAVDFGMARDITFEASVGAAVATHTPMTNRELIPWLQSMHLTSVYPGALGYTFYARVPTSQLGSYRAAMASDPEPGLGPVPARIVSATDHPYYCLPRLGIILGSIGTGAGLDLCSPTLPGIGPNGVAALLQASMDGDIVQFMNLGAVLAPVAAELHLSAAILAQYEGLFALYVPVYAGGTAPTTVAGREAALIGWMLGTFNGPTMLHAAGLSTGGRSLTVSAGGSVLTTTGGPTRGMHLTVPLTIPTLSATVSAPASSAPVWEGVILGLIVLALTGAVSGFLLHLSRTRDRALLLVDERTAELRHQALHDVLTGLPNRALLFDRADQMLARARRQPMAVGALYVDLDNFKDINDTFGHDVGDQLLVAVAERLAGAVRHGDTVGRLGGDEFLILTETVSLDRGPVTVAEQVISVLEEPFALCTPEPITLSVKASVGLAMGMRDSSQELIRDADIALYQAKEAGKGRFKLFDPQMQTAIKDRLRLEMDLHRALERDELFVVYQPIMDIRRMTTRGVETLVRWRHPTRGLIGPSDFIPLAEQSGLIAPIGRFVLEQACAEVAGWRRLGFDLNISVNVSVAQFDDDGFAAAVSDVLGRYDLDHSHLTLEITETLLMHDTQATAQFLRDLKATGVRIAIDDFGTGHSSLAYLRQFPIDSLKIDRSFITRIGQNTQALAIVRSMVQLGKTLGIETLAEGIEDASQLAQLQKEQCDSGQGYLFARPLPAEDVPAFLAEHGAACAAADSSDHDAVYAAAPAP